MNLIPNNILLGIILIISLSLAGSVAYIQHLNKEIGSLEAVNAQLVQTTKDQIKSKENVVESKEVDNTVVADKDGIIVDLQAKLKDSLSALHNIPKSKCTQNETTSINVDTRLPDNVIQLLNNSDNNR